MEVRPESIQWGARAGEDTGSRNSFQGRQVRPGSGPPRPGRPGRHLPAGLRAVELQRVLGGHEGCPHLPRSPIDHVALVRVPEVDLREAGRHRAEGSPAAGVATSRAVRPGVRGTPQFPVPSLDRSQAPQRDGLAQRQERCWKVRLGWGLSHLVCKMGLSPTHPRMQQGGEVARGTSTCPSQRGSHQTLPETRGSKQVAH